MAEPVFLLAYANDRSDPERYLRNLVDEVRAVRTALEDKISPPYRIEVRPNATLDDIIKVFDRYEGQVRIFHYAGHADSLQLMFEGDDKHQGFASQEGFTRLLASQKGLRLAFLNGCTTQNHALSMVEAGIPAVVATSQLINDSAALMFADRFYQQIGNQKSISKSFDDAEIKVQTALTGGGNGGYRGLYWGKKNVEIPNVFPWELYGVKKDWRVQVKKASSKGSIVHLMVNRDRQAEHFRDTVDYILENTLHPPQFFVIHGSRNEKHRSLVTRFKEANIRYSAERILGEDQGIVHFYDMKEWPYTGELPMRQRNLKRSIARAIEFDGLAGSSWDGKDLIERQKSRGKVVIFQHTISAEKWDTNTLKLIKWYIKEFWQVDGKELPQFIIFLNIIYPEESQNAISKLFGGATRRQRIQKQLRELGAEEGELFQVLREIKPVTYEDVVNWVDEYFADELSGMADIIYASNNRKPLPMEVVEYQLKKEIDRINKEKAQRELFDELEDA
ncbi:MAG: CHAT domain-containing protein [Bacteroidia bacterium]|nr:CHAT domain-containing protein [Bacteroidia bacterium]